MILFLTNNQLSLIFQPSAQLGVTFPYAMSLADKGFVFEQGHVFKSVRMMIQKNIMWKKRKPLMNVFVSVLMEWRRKF